MYSTAEFRKGLKIEFQGEPYIIVDFQHVKPGKGGAFVRTRLKNLVTGLVRDETFRSGDKVGRPDLQEREMQYLYRDAGQYCFMDTSTYEQFYLTEEQLGDSRLYLYRRGELSQVTQDHSLVGDQVRRGLITPEAAAHSTLQNILTRAVGSQVGREIIRGVLGSLLGGSSGGRRRR